MIDLTIAQQILAVGLGLGFGVVALTQQLKKWIEALFRLSWKYLGQVLSFLISAGATAIFLSAQGWSWMQFVVYTILVWCLANGYFKTMKSPTEPSSKAY